MKSRLLALFLMLALASWAQTATQSTTDKPGDAATKCSCCEKMASGAADTMACCHPKKAKAGDNAPTCCGKDAKSCCGDAAKCTRPKSAGAKTAPCCSGNAQCGKDKKGCCGEALQTAKAGCCGKQCGMKSPSPTELPN